MKTFKEKLSSAGFSLIELLVAMTIFIVVIGAILGMFVSAIKIQRYVLSSQYLLDQSSYAMEYMSKGLRMAKKDLTGSCIPAFTNYNWGMVSGGTFVDGLVFKKEASGTPPSLKCKEFFLESGQLKDYEDDRGVLPLTSANKLEVLDFSVTDFGWAQPGLLVPSGDNLQPRLTMSLGIKALGGDPQPMIRLQTTVSQRDLDVKEVAP